MATELRKNWLAPARRAEIGTLLAYIPTSQRDTEARSHRTHAHGSLTSLAATLSAALLARSRAFTIMRPRVTHIHTRAYSAHVLYISMMRLKCRCATKTTRNNISVSSRVLLSLRESCHFSDSVSSHLTDSLTHRATARRRGHKRHGSLRAHARYHNTYTQTSGHVDSRLSSLVFSRDTTPSTPLPSDRATSIEPKRPVI